MGTSLSFITPLPDKLEHNPTLLSNYKAHMGEIHLLIITKGASLLKLGGLKLIPLEGYHAIRKQILIIKMPTNLHFLRLDRIVQVVIM